MGTVAIVGLPNVGKSQLFNRLAREKLAISTNQPGTTRDRLYCQVNWLNHDFHLIDTGGFVLNGKNDLAVNINLQIELAIHEADLILYVVSFQDPVNYQIEWTARKLQRHKKPIILVVNKYDHRTAVEEQLEFYNLGFKKIFFVSAEHGIMIGDLLDYIVKLLPRHQEQESKDVWKKLALIGLPNAGKSSLINSILQQSRVVVSEVPGTTTDAVSHHLVHDHHNYLVTDTAGLTRKRFEKLKKFAWYQTQKAIFKSDIILFVIDVMQPLTEYMKNIAGLAFKNYKSIVILANKCDLIKNQKRLAVIKTEIKAFFQFIFYAPILMVSAVTYKNLNIIFKTLDKINLMLHTTIKSHVLNNIVMTAQLIHAPARHQRGLIKIYYVTQIKDQIPTFVFFVNNKKYLHFSYKRFLENQIRKNFNFSMVPIRLFFRNKQKTF